MGTYEPTFQMRLAQGTAGSVPFINALKELVDWIQPEILDDNYEVLQRSDYESQLVLEITTGVNNVPENADELFNFIEGTLLPSYPGLIHETLELEPETEPPDQAPLRHFHVFERGSGVVPALVLNVASEGEALNFFAREKWQTMRQRVDLRDFHAVEFQQPNQACILLEPRKVNPTIPSEQPRPDEPPSRAPPGANRLENA